MQKLFETFDHKADIGIRGFGSTIEKAFENGAKAMFSVIANLRKVNAVRKVKIKGEAPDEASLFVEWLNALLTEADIKDLVFSKFKVKISKRNDDFQIIGEAWGEKRQEKHQLKTEVKAATYSQLKVKKIRGRWVAQCIVDV